MKILLINSCHYYKGGSETVYFNTADILKDHGHEILHFSVSNPENVENEYSDYFAPFHDYRKLPLSAKIIHSGSFIYNGKSAIALNKLIQRFKPDIAHIHLFLGGLTTSILKILKNHGIPSVHTVHDYRLICPAYLCIDGGGKVCDKCISDKSYLRCSLSKCSESNLSQSLMLTLDAYFRKYFINPLNYIDHFLFVSRFSRNKHIHSNSNFNSKSSLLYNFIPELDKIPVTSEKGNYFLFFGRLSREKGVKFLLNAVRDLNINLKVAGEGPLSSDLDKYNMENVEILGYKSGEELRDLIKNSSFVIVPSQWYENNPMTILESFSLGKPVIGSNIGGIPELIVHGKNGFLFEYNNRSGLASAISKACNMPDEEYKSFSANARSFVEMNCSPENHYSELFRIYNRIISRA